MLAVQGPRSAELLDALGLPTEHDYMSFVEGRAGRRRPARLPHRLHRRARLRAGRPVGGGRRAVGRVLAAGAGVGSGPAASAPATRCAPRWATRCTARTSRPTITPVQARAGWAVGWDKPAFRGRDALVAEKEAGPGAPLRRAWSSLERGIPRPHMAVSTVDGAPLGEVTSGHVLADAARSGIALALLDTSAGSPTATRCSSTCAAAPSRSPSSSRRSSTARPADRWSVRARRTTGPGRAAGAVPGREAPVVRLAECGAATGSC